MTKNFLNLIGADMPLSSNVEAKLKAALAAARYAQTEVKIRPFSAETWDMCVEQKGRVENCGEMEYRVEHFIHKTDGVSAPISYGVHYHASYEDFIKGFQDTRYTTYHHFIFVVKKSDTELECFVVDCEKGRKEFARMVHLVY